MPQPHHSAHVATLVPATPERWRNRLRAVGRYCGHPTDWAAPGMKLVKDRGIIIRTEAKDKSGSSSHNPKHVSVWRERAPRMPPRSRVRPALSRRGNATGPLTVRVARQPCPATPPPRNGHHVRQFVDWFGSSTQAASSSPMSGRCLNQPRWERRDKIGGSASVPSPTATALFTASRGGLRRRG